MLIIDGHNLIPKIPWLSLEEMDDEEHLIKLLQRYARLKRKSIEVFFDGAPPGLAGERMAGTVRAHFVPTGQTADEAIRQRVAGLGRMARNATVVSSDRQVQANARALHAQVRTSDVFAAELVGLLQNQEASAARGKSLSQASAPAAHVPPQEIGEWLDLFGIDPARAEQPIPMAKSAGSKRKAGRLKSPARNSEPNPVKSSAKKKNRPHHGFPKKS